MTEGRILFTKRMAVAGMRGCSSPVRNLAFFRAGARAFRVDPDGLVDHGSPEMVSLPPTDTEVHRLL